MPNDLVCGSCRHLNDPWRRHCGDCGSGLPGGCPGCGTVNRIDDKFCGGCARALRFVSPRDTGTGRPIRQRPPESRPSTVPIDISELLADGPKRS